MDYGNLKVPENITPEVQAILDRYKTNQDAIQKEHNKQMAKMYGGAALQIGAGALPLGVGGLATKAIASKLVPYVGSKIAQTTATGLGGGLVGGAVEGFGRGLVEGENPWETMVSDGAISTLFGGTLGLAGGKIGKVLAEKALAKGNKLPQQYFDEYVAGLSDNSALGKISPFSKEFGKFRGLKEGYTPAKGEVALDIIADENGNPIPFYHGTPNAGFTEFNPNSHFSKNFDYASIYKNPSASSLQVKQTVNNPGVYEVNLDVNKMFDTRNPVDKNIFLNEYQAYYSPELTKKGLPDWMEAEDLAEWLQSKYPDYDALVVDEGGVGGYGDVVKDRGESYIPFNSNQVKINKLITDQGETIFNNPRQ